jgi:hypothetical protein
MATRDFEPLMKAIEDVLKALGDPQDLDPPLRPKVTRLQAQFEDYKVCCCFRGTVNIKEDERQGPQSQA